MKRKIFIYIPAMGLLIILVLSIAITNRLIGIDFPKLTGSYSVGRANYDLVDPSRKEIFGSDPNANREIVMSVYYPAAVSSNAKPAPYAEGKMADLLAGKIHLPAFALQMVHSHAYENVSVADGEFPVVLFSPGIGTPPLEYTSAVEDLASHGYIVAEIYHTYSIPVTVFSDGRVAMINDAGIRSEIEPDGTSEAQTNKDRNLIGSVWVADARFALDQLTEFNDDDTLLKGHLNLGEVGMYGHSFGGATAAQVLTVDKRFKAGINMDGTAFSMTDSKQIAQPLLWMASDYSNVTDSQLQKVNMTRGEFNTKLQQKNEQRQAFLTSLRSGYLFTLRGSTHSTYITDETLVGPFIPGMKDPLATIDGRRAVNVINTYVSAFFDKYLKDKDTSLLIGANPAYPEVSLRVLGQ
jgi:dienelactone hydrolase